MFQIVAGESWVEASCRPISCIMSFYVIFWSDCITMMEERIPLQISGVFSLSKEGAGRGRKAAE